MEVSPEDKAYFARIGEYKRALAAERLAAHLALPIAERLRRSLALSLEFAEQAVGRANDDPSPFYDRARALGLYDP